MIDSLNITPKVTRGEIRRLWETFIVNKNRTLSFLQFVRHYGYSLKYLMSMFKSDVYVVKHFNCLLLVTVHKINLSSGKSMI